jgi:hypothetical protein
MIAMGDVMIECTRRDEARPRQSAQWRTPPGTLPGARERNLPPAAVRSMESAVVGLALPVSLK